MTDSYSKKSGPIHVQIPVFGDWDNANQLPITQYFASATQAGLVRYSSSSGECGPTVGRRELYAVDLTKKGPTNSHQVKRPKLVNKQRGNIKNQTRKRPQGKAFNAAETPFKVNHNHSVAAVEPPMKPPKPVDEDLYKIPSDQLNHMTSKRSKVKKILSRCLIPACNS